jgi:thiopeptide-type bacteriocin biosynthesis protein
MACPVPTEALTQVPWIYYKLYHQPGLEGERTDAIIADAWRPALFSLREAGLVDLAFFLRYADAEGYHIRLRLHSAEPKRCGPIFLEGLQRALLARALDARLVPSVYEPEIIKHGGPHGTAVGEAQFSASSDFACDCISLTRGRTTIRLLIAAYTMAWTLDAVTLDRAARQRAVESYATYWAEFLRVSSRGRHRPPEVSASLAELWAASKEDEPNLIADLGLSRQMDTLRSQTTSAIGQLHSLASHSMLAVEPLQVVCNLVHTLHNRLGLSIDDELIISRLLTVDDKT